MGHFEMSKHHAGLPAFGRRLAERRADILRHWESNVAADPKLLTGQALPTAQLHDHLTALLEDFERHLYARSDAAREVAEDFQGGDGAAHGLHRWQQGFDLAELVRELGRLNESVVREIERCASEPGHHDADLRTQVHAIWAALYSTAASSSAEQFFKLQQIEAAGHVKDLERALQSLQALESQRATLWKEAAHDLRGNLSVVSVVAAGLASPVADAAAKDRFIASLARNVRSLHSTLQDVTSLARLQGGQEVRELAPVDIAALLSELVEATESLAQDRKLFLRVEGSETFMVEGDAAKIRRIAQNLALNALKYTKQGGVTLRWGNEAMNSSARWFIEVQDTGPGLQAGPGSPIAGAISVASEQARDVAVADAQGDVAHVSIEESSPEPETDPRGSVQTPGEGIGLSIVKRLCTLLDAGIEIETEPNSGTTFRVLFPRYYAA